VSRAALLALALVALAGNPVVAQPPPPPDRFALDADRFHFSRVEWDAPVRSEGHNPDEFLAYNELIEFARQFTTAELLAHGSRDVTYRDLVRPAGKDFQYKLLAFTGRLKRVRRMEPTKPLKAAGVADLYECWVFPANVTEPLCLVTTELPTGIEPKLEFAPTRNVRFGAYYFKLMQYESAEPLKDRPGHNVVRRAPLLMGRGFEVEPLPDTDGGAPWREAFLPGMIVLVGGLIAAGYGLTWWFRRGDRAAKAAIEQRRDRNPFPDGGPLA
jgi:hypothetical protein